MLHLEQPTGEYVLKFSVFCKPNFAGSLPSVFKVSKINLIFCNSSALGSFSLRQFLQSRRTRRWAMDSVRAEPIILGLTSRSIKRGITPAALLVWRVENT